MTESNNNNYIWVKDFNEESTRDFYEEFSRLERDRSVKVITIIIDSYGGSVHSVLSMRDLIKSSVKPVSTICLGKAMSAGAILLAAGTKGYRFATPSSFIMVHEVSSAAYGKNSDIQADAVFLKLLNEKLFQFLAEDTGKSLAKFTKEIEKRKNADWMISPDEAKKLGIIDFIEVPRLVTQDAATGLVVMKRDQKA